MNNSGDISNWLEGLPLDEVDKAALAQILSDKRTLEKKYTALEKAYDELESFSHMVSHDLKNPLRNISSFAQLLKVQCGAQLPDNARESLAFIIKGCKQINEVIIDLLDFAKAGKHTEDTTRVDLNTVLELVKINLNSLIKENSAQIVITKPLPHLLINKSKLIQLFQNLIENSIKFRSEKEPVIEINCQQENEHTWTFYVNDNGIGIAPSFSDKVFLPFQRHDLHNRPGTGIGLAICQKVVQSYAGNIYFQDLPHGGTSFIFTLSENIPLTNRTQSKADIAPPSVV